MKKICVVGAGYVGLSNAVLLANAGYDVKLIDIVKEKVDLINRGISPIDDKEIKEYLVKVVQSGKLKATTETNYKECDYVIIATPTDYDEVTNYFNTSTVEKVIEDVLSQNKDALIIIKSTIPVGFVQNMRKKFNSENIIFSPEFLREGKALYDNFYPSRIVVGEKSERAKEFAEMLKNAAFKEDVEILLTNPTEAEAIKLFANTYLAMRVAFFNELDSYAMHHNLNSKDIIKGVCLDPRIGMYYNNPSFGYGGYCLPKDTKQLLANYKDIPNELMRAIVEANEVRKNYIVEKVLEKNPKLIGVYRLTMKTESDNFRSASILDIISRLAFKGERIKIYEPHLKKDELKYYFSEGIIKNIEVVDSIDELNSCDIILANRVDEKIEKYKDKVFSRDIFREN